MVAVEPLWINGVAVDGLRLRRFHTLLSMTNGSPLGARQGVIPGTNGLNVTLSGSTLSVGSGSAWVYQAGQGLYGVTLGSATATLDPAHATLARIDLLYLRVWDNSVDGSGLNTADVVYLAGTASATPVVPTPAGTQIYLRIATISVPASGGGSPSVSQSVRPWTVAPGGILPDATATGYYAGQYRDNGTGLERYTGSTWKPCGPFLPQQTNQVNEPGYGTTSAFVDFTTGQWPALTFTVPASGMVWISISGAPTNTNTTASTAWMSWRASGGYTEASSEANGLSSYGGRTYATRRVLRSGLTPGATVTLTPQWQISSIGAGVTRVINGQLTVEPIAVP
ncbi:hypothetical protein ACIOHE_15595 [Streptomyces sp. NPDC087851]|uniref:hypothetical protein n=1 Tax=Streptomyces sp. NPDC087851 TaxID=3365810 RepID=UPI0037F8AB5F